MKQKRLVTAQDISCIGKCSLCAALPVISAFGIETAVLPTALLSTHTGGFEGYTFSDLTGEMRKIIRHWQTLGLEFDAMYSGYFGSIEQLELVGDFFKSVKTDSNLIFTDPVMGDDGELYAGFDDAFVKAMRAFCSSADIITPNVTEAALLTATPYKSDYDEQYIREMAYRLADTGASKIVITGISVGNKSGAMCYDAKSDSFCTYFRPRIDGVFYGTGDLFASALCGAVTTGIDFESAMSTAVDFVYESILNTLDEKDKYRYGVKFEQSLKMLTDLAPRE